MTRYRERLPQLNGGLFLTDGGLETTLVFHDGIELPQFASFNLLKTEAGERRLKSYYRTYADIAKRAGTGMILESVSWRASRDWGEKLGYTKKSLAEANRKSIAILEEIRQEYEPGTEAVISGCVGPRGDGYKANREMGMKEAEEYHAEQIGVLADSAADMVSAFTLSTAGEAAGIALAARKAGIPAVISFTVETDGRLPDGDGLGETIDRVDQATGGYPAYYMVNCAHPEHFEQVLASGGEWTGRIRGVRGNASRKSHAELDESTELDAGDPGEFGALNARLMRHLPGLSVLGGCCGTDHRHVEQIAAWCAPQGRAQGAGAG